MDYTLSTATLPNPTISKTAAEQSLQHAPQFVAGTKIGSLELDPEKGWVAELFIPKTAGDNPFGPSSDEESGDTTPADEPKAETPKTDDSSSDDSDSKSDDKKDEAKKEDKNSDGKVDIKDVMELVQQIADAVGVTGGPDGEGLGDPGEGDILDLAGPPGEGELPGGPPAGGPPGPPGAPSGPDGKSHTVHERALKPGEAPPGTTPIGSPAFASTRKAASFDINEPSDLSVGEAQHSIEASFPGYKVKRIREENVNGVRHIVAAVSVR